MSGKMGLMERRRALVGKEVVIAADLRTKGGSVFRAGERVRVTSVKRGDSPFHLEGEGGKRVWTEEDAFVPTDSGRAEDLLRRAAAQVASGEPPPLVNMNLLEERSLRQIVAGHVPATRTAQQRVRWGRLVERLRALGVVRPEAEGPLAASPEGLRWIEETDRRRGVKRIEKEA